MVALLASLAVLFVGEVMGQVPCPLCWYQRAFMFPLALILGLAVRRSDVGIKPYALLLAAGGWLVATYHTLLFYRVIPAPIVPCDATLSCTGPAMLLFGAVAIPLLAVLAFSLIITLLLMVPKGART